VPLSSDGDAHVLVSYQQLKHVGPRCVNAKISSADMFAGIFKVGIDVGPGVVTSTHGYSSSSYFLCMRCQVGYAVVVWSRWPMLSSTVALEISGLFWQQCFDDNHNHTLFLSTFKFTSTSTSILSHPLPFPFASQPHYYTRLNLHGQSHLAGVLTTRARGSACQPEARAPCSLPLVQPPTVWGSFGRPV
jgi:hypothetical protein